MPEIVEQAKSANGGDALPDERASAEAKATRRRWKSRAVVALVLLLAVGTGLALRSSWGRGNHADRNIVAAYDGGVITRETLLERWRTAPADQQATMRTPEGIDLTVRSMAVHAVLERWARERRLDAREMFIRAMRQATQ